MQSPHDQITFMSMTNGRDVNFAEPRSFGANIKSHTKEALFPDDPFKEFKGKPFKKRLEYFVPIFEWLPKYSWRTLIHHDLIAGITIASLAVPQGISYAKLAKIPPIIGLYSSFIPPLIYSIFGSSKHIAIGTVAACSLLLSSIIEEKVSHEDNPTLYLHLVFTAAFFTGIMQSLLGFLRLGILVDFLSHSTIIGFMSGTAIILCLQQLKDMFGISHFTNKTDIISVVRAIISNKNEWQWEPAVAAICFLLLLFSTRHLAKKKPQLFWVSAISPMTIVIFGCLLTYFGHVEKRGIKIVGPLKKGINPISIQHLNFSSKYLSVTLKAGIIPGILAMAEGIAIGRSFAVLNNYQTDGCKEMVAFGLMNIVGSFTSCYLTTGPFSKSAVNASAGSHSAMSNVVMSVCMLVVLLVLAPVFSYTPLVALSAIIFVAMFGLIKYEEVYRLYKIDKFDFIICMSAILGVTFFSMDVGLFASFGLSIVRVLLYVARPATFKLVRVPNSALFRDVEQYPGSNEDEFPGVLILDLGSPIYFANCTYIKDRVWRSIREENSKGNVIEHVLLDFGGVRTIDVSGLEMLQDLKRSLESSKIKVLIINPRTEVMDKMIMSRFVEKIGKELFFLSIEDAVEACKFSMHVEQKADISKPDDV